MGTGRPCVAPDRPLPLPSLASSHGTPACLRPLLLLPLGNHYHPFTTIFHVSSLFLSLRVDHSLIHTDPPFPCAPSQADSDFTGRLFDCCGLLSVGDDERAGHRHRRRRVEAFLDKKRLQPGRPFATDFVAALATSKVALPIVSRGSLEPMAQLTSGAPCDNVLLEWSVMVELQEAHRQLVSAARPDGDGGPATTAARAQPFAVVPILLGDVDETPGEPVSMTDVLATPAATPAPTPALPSPSPPPPPATLVQAMPEVVVESVAAKATTVLESLGMRPSGALRTRTVKDVVDAVIGNLGIRVDQVLQECRDEGGSLEDLAVSGVHRRCMDKVCRVLETLPTAATPWSAPVPVPAAAVVAPASSSPSSSSSSSSHPPPTPAISRVVPPAPAARPASVTVCAV